MESKTEFPGRLVGDKVVDTSDRRPSEIGKLAKPVTHDGILGRAEDVPLNLFMRPLGDVGYERFLIRAMPRTSSRVLKAQIRARCGGLTSVPDHEMRLLYRGVELPDDGPVMQHLPIEGCVLAQQEGMLEIQFLILRGQVRPEEPTIDADLYVAPGVPCPEQLQQIVRSCLAGFQLGSQPLLTSSGTGGCYFLRGLLHNDKRDIRTLAVFKPKDEEAFCPQNPRGFEGPENSRSVRPGVKSAHRAVREVAAYLLDHDGFAGVPMTTLAHGRHPGYVQPKETDAIVWKIGALQAFVDTSETADNFGPQIFAAVDVHRIGILDIRIANMDRNYGNLLVKVAQEHIMSRKLHLTPIDHGCSLPDRLGIEVNDVVWMAWPQSKQPFSQDELRYISSLDGPKDASMLSEKLGLERPGLRLLEVTTVWLQAAASHGLTLHEMGAALYRDGSMSLVEKVLEACVDMTFASSRSELERSSSDSDSLRVTSTFAPEVASVTDGIFVRRDNRGNAIFWTPQHEVIFGRYVSDRLQRFARERAPSLPPSLAPPTPSPKHVEDEPSLSLADLSGRCSRAWVPRYRQRQMAAQEAQQVAEPVPG